MRCESLDWPVLSRTTSACSVRGRSTAAFLVVVHNFRPFSPSPSLSSLSLPLPRPLSLPQVRASPQLGGGTAGRIFAISTRLPLSQALFSRSSPLTFLPLSFFSPPVPLSLCPSVPDTIPSRATLDPQSQPH